MKNNLQAADLILNEKSTYYRLELYLYSLIPSIGLNKQVFVEANNKLEPSRFQPELSLIANIAIRTYTF